MSEPQLAWETERAATGRPAVAPTVAAPGLLGQTLTTLLGLGGIAALLYGLSRTGILDQVGDWITSLGPWAYLVFPLVYALCNVLLLPAGILSVGAGYLFGLWPGFLMVLAGNVLGAAAAFGISRKLLRRWVSRRIGNSAKLSAFDRAIQREGWKIVFLTQVNPLAPTSLLNYLYGATSLGFRQTMLWVCLGQIPGLFLYAYLGWVGQGPWAEVVATGPAADNAAASGGLGPVGGAWFWAGGLLLTVLLTIYLRSLAQRVLRDSMEKPGP